MNPPPLATLARLTAPQTRRRIRGNPTGTEARRTAHSAEQTAHLVAPIRRELVGRLAAAGMSTRAIAPVVGVSSPQTVVNDLRKTGVQRLDTSAPDPLAEEKADGRVVKLTGPGSLLHSEPVERIDMETGEVLTIGQRLEELERPKAAERQGRRTDLYPTSASTDAEVGSAGRVDMTVADALGISAATYGRTRRTGRPHVEKSTRPCRRRSALDIGPFQRRREFIAETNPDQLHHSPLEPDPVRVPAVERVRQLVQYGPSVKASGIEVHHPVGIHPSSQLRTLLVPVRQIERNLERRQSPAQGSPSSPVRDAGTPLRHLFGRDGQLFIGQPRVSKDHLLHPVDVFTFSPVRIGDTGAHADHPSIGATP